MEFYIRITKPVAAVNSYYLAHDGIEHCGLTSEEVVEQVTNLVGIENRNGHAHALIQQIINSYDRYFDGGRIKLLNRLRAVI